MFSSDEQMVIEKFIMSMGVRLCNKLPNTVMEVEKMRQLKEWRDPTY
jgi:hypothetical protein